MMLMHDGRYNNNRLPAGPMEYDDEKDDFPAHLRIYVIVILESQGV